MTQPILISEQNFQAVTAADLRAYLRADDGETDAQLDFYIQSATDYLQKAARCTIIRKRYKATYHNCQHTSYYLPFGPVDSLVEVLIDGKISDISLFELNGDQLILPHFINKLEITYDTGFASAQQVPPAYQMAILACSSDLFIHRFTDPQSIQPLSHQMIKYYINLLKNISI